MLSWKGHAVWKDRLFPLALVVAIVVTLWTVVVRRNAWSPPLQRTRPSPVEETAFPSLSRSLPASTPTDPR